MLVFCVMCDVVLMCDVDVWCDLCGVICVMCLMDGVCWYCVGGCV